MPKLSLSLGLDLYIAFLISKILCWLHSLKVLYMYTGKLWPPSHLPRGCLPIKLTAIRRSSDDLQWTKMIPYDFICSQDVLRIFSGCTQDVLRNVLGTFLECSQDLWERSQDLFRMFFRWSQNDLRAKDINIDSSLDFSDLLAPQVPW